ncbi:fimbrial protein [Burkholderia sp. AU38729]|uniref:fimbrial protein n=1 Tax=Burkholderia sp. AU38729 TaxID=2879633 RepID=UPI001CF2E47E|nr:fimbrial protein [Burkholderia sp. AU38729]MCA8066508.1 type 1 fimbrial protein [Burkholderia sp. AU38729]
MNQNRKRSVATSAGLGLAVLLSALAPGDASALECKALTGETLPLTRKIASFSTPSFSPSVPVGTVLHSQKAVAKPASGKPTEIKCDNYFRAIKHAADKVTGAYNTWPTSIAGIGIRIRIDNDSTDWWPYTIFTSQTTLTSGNFPFVIEFVKTGPITAGGTISGEITGSWLDSVKYASYVMEGDIVIKPVVPTCKVRQTSLSVPLGDIAANRVMPNVGDTSEAKPFKIVLDCSGGEVGSITRTFMTLTDVNDNANIGSTLTLSPESSAKGVGVQVLNGSKVVSYGPDSSETGNTNQFSTGATKNGVLEIPLSARYVRTGMMIGGTVKARASFTMSYQ